MSDEQNAIVQHDSQSNNVDVINGVLQPRNGKGIMELARVMSNSGMFPNFKQPEQAFVAIAKGMALGLDPMSSLESIAVINGRAGIFGDAALALVMASGLLEDIEETFEGENCAVCRVSRKGKKTAVEARFDQEDAKRAGLWGKGGPWTQYPKRMLKLRARGFALRDAFPDVLKGMKTVEEIRDYPDEIETTASVRAPDPAVAEPGDSSGNFRDGFSAKPAPKADPKPEPEKKVEPKPARKPKPAPPPEPEPEEVVEAEVIEEPPFDEDDVDGDELF